MYLAGYYTSYFSSMKIVYNSASICSYLPNIFLKARLLEILLNLKKEKSLGIRSKMKIIYLYLFINILKIVKNYPKKYWIVVVKYIPKKFIFTFHLSRHEKFVK